MRTHHSQHHSKLKMVVYISILAIMFAVVSPALADYIGPKRTVTVTLTDCDIILYECQYVAAKGDYRYHQINSWSCSNESKPWRSYSGQASGCDSSSTGDKYWARKESSSQVTTTYPEATITGVLQSCTLNNGWCTASPQLSLSASEPVSGKQILGIEGTRNGEIFACTGSTCSLPLVEGNNDFTYWAHSSFNDTTRMGTLNARVDTVQPVISGTLTGIAGSNGWYVSPVAFNGSAFDDTSGLAAFTCTLDGTALGSCSSITIDGEGTHTLVLTARDNAGQTVTLKENTAIDTQDPTLNVSLAGTWGANSAWYTSAALNGSASDPLPGSGLSSFVYRLDQNGWTDFPASGELALPDGEHTVEVRATDNAGWSVSSQKSFSLDSIPPVITIVPAGTTGSNNWYTTDLQLTAAASDETSGLKEFEYSLNSDSWTPYSSQVVLKDGIHEISFWARDEAGLVAQVSKTYQVDTQVPVIGGNLSGVPGQNGWFISGVTISASALDPQPGSGIDTFTYSLDGAQEVPLTSPLVLSDGQHELQLTARDKAGLSHTTEQIVKVDSLPPALDIQTVLPGWVRESVTLEGTAVDSGSGLSKVEISTDGGQTWQTIPGTTPWNYRWDTSKNANGPGEVLVKVIDQAGLSVSQSMKTGVDNKAPHISLPDSWFQWDTITLDIQEEHSGLSEASLEISDPKKRWPARIIPLNTAVFPMRFKWDRRFADGTTAPEGTYDVKIIAVDRLGNSAMETASVKILLNLPPGPTSTLIPTSRSSATPTISFTATPTPIHTATPAVVLKGFGSTLEPEATATPKPALPSTPRSVPTQNRVVEWFESLFPSHSEAAPGITEISSPVGAGLLSPDTNTGSNVLWGASAAAVMASLAAYGLEEKRKQPEQTPKPNISDIHEEERRKRIKKKQMTQLEAKWAQERAWEAEREAKKAEQEAHYQAHNELRVLTREIEEEAKRVAEKEAERAREEARKKQEEEEKAAEKLRAAMAAYSAGRQKAVTDVATPAKTTSKWEKAWKWVDEHQTEIALGIGVAVGVAAVVLSGGIAAPLVALAWTAGAAAVAGGIVTLGTVALNSHFNRPLGTNILHNVAVAAGSAVATASVGFALAGGIVQQALYRVGNTITQVCIQRPPACARVTAGIQLWDKVEDLGLKAKFALQTARGDPNAADTALELQMEQLDNTPGNTTFKEVYETATYLISKKNDDIAKISKIITRFGPSAKIDEDGLIHFAEDVAPEVVEEVVQELRAIHGQSVWVTSGKIYVSSSTQKAIEAVAKLKVAVSSGADVETIDKLIFQVADASSHGKGNKVVLGRWLAGSGYIGEALDEGATFFDTGDAVWKLLKESGVDPWRVNEAFLRRQLEAGIEKIEFVGDDIFSIITNADDRVRNSYSAKEIRWLLDNAQQYGYDLVNNSWIKKVLN